MAQSKTKNTNDDITEKGKLEFEKAAYIRDLIKKLKEEN